MRRKFLFFILFLTPQINNPQVYQNQSISVGNNYIPITSTVKGELAWIDTKIQGVNWALVQAGNFKQQKTLADYFFVQPAFPSTPLAAGLYYTLRIHDIFYPQDRTQNYQTLINISQSPQPSALYGPVLNAQMNTTYFWVPDGSKLKLNQFSQKGISYPSANLENIKNKWIAETTLYQRLSDPVQIGVTLSGKNVVNGGLFEYVTNIKSEETFRRNYAIPAGWSRQSRKNKLYELVEDKAANKVRLRNQLLPASFDQKFSYPVAAIFQGELELPTIGDLKQKIKNRTPFKQHGFFTILFHDPSDDSITDIRALQAKPQNKYCAFQLASTFCGQEGRVGYPPKSNSPHYLANMFKSPVQGEFSTSGAFAAGIAKRYLYRQINALERLKNNFIVNPKQNIKIYMDAFTGYTRMHKDTYDRIDKVKSFTIDDRNLDNVTVPIDKDIVVVSGYQAVGAKSKPNIKNYQLPTFVLPDGTVDQQRSQVITHILNSAVTFTDKFFRYRKNQNMQNFAKFILKAQYLGAVLGAIASGCPKLYLTLVGGGAFRNDIDWIINAIATEDIKNLIQKYNLQVILSYRTDKPRKNQIRSASGDQKAIAKLVNWMNTVNKKQISNVTSKINNYINSGYAQKLDAQLAKDLNNVFNPSNFVPTPKKPKPSPPSVKPAKTNIKDYSMYQELKKYVNTDPTEIKSPKKAQELIDAIDNLRNLIKDKKIITFDASEWNKISNMRKSLVNRKNELLKPAPKGPTKDPLIDALQTLGSRLNALKNSL